MSGCPPAAGATRFRVTCGDFVLVIDTPRNWREQQLVLRSIQHWRFVIEQAKEHNLPKVWNIATGTGELIDLKPGEPS